MVGHASGVRPLAMEEAEEVDEPPSTPKRACAKICAVFYGQYGAVEHGGDSR